jgi:pilus assembly protein CpaB
MSQSINAATPGKANKRFLMLALMLGLIGAVLVYVTFSRAEDDGTTIVRGDTPVVVAKQDIPARTVITQSMVETRLVNEDGISPLAFGDTAAVVGQVTRYPLTVGEQVLSSKIVSLTGGLPGTQSLSYVVPQGKRGMSITVEEVVNAGGLVLPGDYVDIIIIYDVQFPSPTDPNSREVVDNYYVKTEFQNIEVLAVSQAVVDVVPEAAATPTAGGHRARNSEHAPNAGAATVTLSLTPEEAQRLYLMEQNGRVRLAVRSYTDDESIPIDYMIERDIIPRDLPSPFDP